MGKNNPMVIKNFCDKMEFQGRGAGHIHGVAWSDLKKVSELIKEENKSGIILSNTNRQPQNNETHSDCSPLKMHIRS